ncbi:MAG: hypothetical protein DRN20_03455 [Thermoplasmata archaeon]|nr:MAG: hypothetical protein DRN20_03455 [Thermoplasmata archaeon]
MSKASKKLLGWELFMPSPFLQYCNINWCDLGNDKPEDPIKNILKGLGLYADYIQELVRQLAEEDTDYKQVIKDDAINAINRMKYWLFWLNKFIEKERERNEQNNAT